MGIPNFLPDVLHAAGHDVDLRCFDGVVLSDESGKQTKRPVIMGVDVQTWIHRAAIGLGSSLLDEKHLSNYGRSILTQEERKRGKSSTAEETKNNEDENLPKNVIKYVTICVKEVVQRLLNLQKDTKATVFVVLDGKTPPIKMPEVENRRNQRQKHVFERDRPVSDTMQAADSEEAIRRRTTANRRAGAGEYFEVIVKELVHALGQLQIPFLIAPYEADSQLAYLSRERLIDIVITEDSDLIALGARTIVYKSLETTEKKGFPSGILFQMSDIGAVHYKRMSLLDYSPVMLAVVFVAQGCDYCPKLQGIGISTACKVVRRAFLEPRNDRKRSGLSIVFDELFKAAYDQHTVEFRTNYEEKFMLALLMYRHPIAFDPTKGTCLIVGDPLHKGGDPELIDHEPYARLCRDANRIHAVVGEIQDPKTECEKAQAIGWERHPAFAGNRN